MISSSQIYAFLVVGLCVMASLPYVAYADHFIAIYGGGPFYSGGNPNIKSNIADLKASGFTAVVCWCIHVYANGDLWYNDKQLTSNGQYVGDSDWPSYIADLKTGQTSVKKVFLSVGSGGVDDFTSIKNLIDSQGTGPDSILYKNFAVLKQLIPSLDGIDLDDEDLYDQDSMVKFSLMLGKIGYKISFCAYTYQTFWISCLQEISKNSTNLVTQINLQCYSGGEGNDPADWQQSFSAAGLNTPVYPGVWNDEEDSN